MVANPLNVRECRDRVATVATVVLVVLVAAVAAVAVLAARVVQMPGARIVPGSCGANASATEPCRAGGLGR